MGGKAASSRKVTQASRLPVWLSLLAILVAFGIRVQILAGKQVLEVDDGVSLLAATGHEGEYAEIAAQGRPPIGVWTAAAEWKRLIRPEAGRGLSRVAADLAAYDIHPPLFFWVLQAWITVFGTSLPVLGALNLVIDLLTVLALLFSGRWVFGSSDAGWRAAASWLSAAVWALSPIGIKAGFWVRQYPLLTLFTVLFVCLLYRGFRGGAKGPEVTLVRIAAVLVGLAGLLTHYYFALILAVGLLLLAASSLWERKLLWKGVGLLAVVAILFLLLYPGFRQTLATYYESRVAGRLIGFDLQERIRNAVKTILLLVSPALLGLGVWAAARWPIRRAAPESRNAAQSRRPEPAASAEQTTRLMVWLLSFAGIPILALLLAYLAGFTSVYTFSSRYMSFLSPVIALIAVALVLRGNKFIAEDLTPEYLSYALPNEEIPSLPLAENERAEFEILNRRQAAKPTPSAPLRATARMTRIFSQTLSLRGNVNWSLALLIGMFLLGLLTLHPALAESQAGELDIAGLRSSPAVLIDTTAWGTWPAVMQYLRDDQQVMVLDQDHLIADPHTRLDGLSGGGIYVSLIRGEENSRKNQERILQLIEQSYSVTQLSRLYRPNNWSITLFRVSQPATLLAAPSDGEVGSPPGGASLR